MREQLIQFFSERYGWTADEIETAASFEELGLDSLSLYSLVTDCEETFNVKIDTDDITEIDTPEKFIGYVMRKNNL